MGRVRVTIWAVVGVVGLVVCVLCSLGFGAMATLFLIGAPHAVPRSPGLAAILFVATVLLAGIGVIILRRTIRLVSAAGQPR